MKRIFALALAAFIIGCGSREPRPDMPEGVVNVAPGLSAQEVELAVLMAVVDRYDAPQLTAGQAITDSALAAFLGNSYVSARERNPWFFEGRQAGVVYAGYQYRSIYMRTALTFTESQVTLDVVEQRDVGRRRGTIINGLSDRLRRSLGMMAQRRLLGHEPTTAADPGS